MFQPSAHSLNMRALSTAWYAALHGGLYVWLSLRIVVQRRRLRVSLGDAGHHTLQRAIRAHANFAEYVPLALLLMLMTELRGAPAWLLHSMGSALLLARCSHAYGLSSASTQAPFRSAGMAVTLTVLLCAGGYLVFDYLLLL
jgi:uncharacterized protein